MQNSDCGIVAYVEPDCAVSHRKAIPHEDLIYRMLESVREYAPHVPVCVFADFAIQFDGLDLEVRPLRETVRQAGYQVVFDRLDSNQLTDQQKWKLITHLKPIVAMASPFQKVFYIDTDVVFLREIDPIWNISQDVGFVKSWPQKKYPQYAGQFLMNRNPQSAYFLAKWMQIQTSAWSKGRQQGDNFFLDAVLRVSRKDCGLTVKELPWHIWCIRPNNIRQVPDPTKSRLLHMRGKNKADLFAIHGLELSE